MSAIRTRACVAHGCRPGSLGPERRHRGEITKGIVTRERTDPVAAALGRWLDRLRSAYADRILRIDDAVASSWGHLVARRTSPVADGLDAATARKHYLVTRNVLISPTPALTW